MMKLTTCKVCGLGLFIIPGFEEYASKLDCCTKCTSWAYGIIRLTSSYITGVA